MSVPQMPPIDDELNIELDAIQTIARALIRVRDPQARLRVLRWTNERFNAAPAAATSVPPAIASDPTLTVDGLELFPDPAAEMAVADVAPASAAPEPPLDSLVRGFATDFQRVALQWQRA